MTNTLTHEVRRSTRLQAHDSNGRDYLANLMDWSRKSLESWMRSEKVRPHLRDWFRLCVEGSRRYNEAVEWINTGEKGYFYNPSDVEEDMLLKCLYEGVDDSGKILPEGRKDSYAVLGVPTGHWTTQELWARAAWRIVQANAEALDLDGHAAKAYAFVIDLLCIAFHSVAYRGKGSVYYGLIVGFTHAAEVRWAKERVAWLKAHSDEDMAVEPAVDEEMIIDIPMTESSKKETQVDVGLVVEVDIERKSEDVKNWIESVDACTEDDLEEGIESESGASEFAG